MPSGKRLVTMTKNSSAVATLLRVLSASSRSRYTMQRIAASMSAELDHARRGDSRVLVRGEDQRSAARQLLDAERLHELDALRVERRKRLVEQPQRPGRAQREACERRAAP